MISKYYRSKDFYLMEVKREDGKRLGYIKSLDIDFNSGIVRGFILSTYSLNNRNAKVLVEDIIAFNEVMIAKNISNEISLDFDSIKGMDVLDVEGNVLGMVEELLFEGEHYNITGVIISTGLIKDIFDGKIVFQPKDLILGEKNILCKGKGKKLYFQLFNHKHKVEDDRFEKTV